LPGPLREAGFRAISVRLNSFVYTVESFEQVRGHLTEDDLAVVTFAAIDSAPWIEKRLGRTMVKVFGLCLASS
jgi:hypothetical protein